VARIACLAVPLFPLAARLRAEPELGRTAAAVVEGEGPAARLLAATRGARHLGVRAGMTLAQARALLPRLVARGRDGECEAAAAAALVEVAERFSPRVEAAAPGLVFLDADGVARRVPAGGAQGEPERAFGRALARAAAGAGLPAHVGLAASKLAAEIVARGARDGEPGILPEGREAELLAPLPLARLAPLASDPELVATLRRWGLATIGDLARLPAAEVASRLGEAGRRLQTIARGRDPRPLAPAPPPRELREGLELEWPLATLEPFLFLARAALDRLCRRLAADGLGCARLAIALALEPEGIDERALELPAPTCETRTLLRLVHLELERRPPGAAVAGFAFVATPDRPRAAQLALFGPPALAPDRLATTLARLFARLGADRVGSPRTLDGHRPERFRLVPFAPPPPPRIAPAPRPARGLLAVRVLRPALELEVRVDDDGRPRAVEMIPGEANAGRPEVRGGVAVAAGPWRLEEGWWSDAPLAREYWDVELAGGGLWRLFRDAASGRWFADGAYD
jgi:protein ImuB